jgi:hypothetical protein
MKTQFEELMSGLDDVESFLSGEKEGFKVHVPEEVSVDRRFHVACAEPGSQRRGLRRHFYGFILRRDSHQEIHDTKLPG